MTAPQAQLVRTHLPIAHRIAAMLLGRHRLPATVELGDLESAGVIGLIDAAHRFDPSRGYQFSTLAGHRIRGAILDSMRAAAPFSRKHLAAIQSDQAPLVRMMGGRDAERSLADVLAPQSDLPDPIFARRLPLLLRRLPVKEARILVWRHWGGMTQGQCAALLNLSKTRVSQLEEQAYVRLRRMVRH